MTPLAGFVAALIAGWIIRDPRRAAITATVPFLIVMIVQTLGIDAGDAVSPLRPPCQRSTARWQA